VANSTWDPGQYLRFGDERSRPFYDLIGRIGATDPDSVADIGCGPGGLTANLARRWPTADVLGVDNSAEMIAAANQVAADANDVTNLRFDLMNAVDWSPVKPVGVIVSNATIQWIPNHEELLARWVDYLAAGGWLAIQLPANYAEPVHVLMRELINSPRWRSTLGEVELTRQSGDPARYLDLLATAGCQVDAWETTYQHVLTGEDPVLNWVKGTGLRPVLTALTPADKPDFLAEYATLLRQAYPQRPYGTVLPFRRVFAVAHKP
jgi:trans-aconitate 2-methyltransferase